MFQKIALLYQKWLESLCVSPFLIQGGKKTSCYFIKHLISYCCFRDFSINFNAAHESLPTLPRAFLLNPSAYFRLLSIFSWLSWVIPIFCYHPWFFAILARQAFIWLRHFITLIFISQAIFIPPVSKLSNCLPSTCLILAKAHF